VREFREHGSVRGALSNERPYRDQSNRQVGIKVEGKVTPAILVSAEIRSFESSPTESSGARQSKFGGFLIAVLRL
jgi:hypothetical protein